MTKRNAGDQRSPEHSSASPPKANGHDAATPATTAYGYPNTPKNAPSP
jgi:hypothetical protein